MTPKDMDILRAAKRVSLMGPKLDHLFNSALQCVGVRGSIAEVGVYKGGSAMVLCHVFRGEPVFGFDTYTGIPEDDSLVPDGHKKGDFSDTSPLLVAMLMRNNGITNFKPVVGRFEGTKMNFENHRFAFVHLDADIYQSTKAACDFFVPRLAKGGGLFFDDAKSNKCLGVLTCINELMETGEFVKEDGHGTAFLRKHAK